MKCPSCSYICSKERTKCPKCGNKLSSKNPELLEAIPTSASIEELYQMEEARKVREAINTVKRANFSLPYGPLISPYDDLPNAAFIGGIGVSNINHLDPHHAEVKTLFDKAEISLEEDLMFEFSSNQMGVKLKNDEIQMLFELADESLSDPEASKRYIDSVSTSHLRTVRSKFLSEQLLKVEQFFDHPILSLTGKGIKQEDFVDIAIQNSKPNAPTIKRFFSALIDKGVIFATSFLIVLSTSLLEIGQISDALLYGLKPRDIYDLLRPLSLFTEISLFALIIYPLLSFLLFRSTVGMKLMNLLLIREGGGIPRMGNILVRVFVYPLSVLLLGGTPSIFGKRTLHDHMAKTRIVGYALGE